MIAGQFATDDVEQASQPYLGQWHRLVSTTNWEKGRIISAWREALRAAGAPAAEFSDEAWSRRVGNVSGQHVGRLRRVYERFGSQQEDFRGLFWSHFQASLDWNDSEMWLEGAVQSGWSISEMRRQRWLALGAPAELKPRDEDIIVAELDEDSRSEDDDPGSLDISDSVGVVRSPARRSGDADEADYDSASGAEPAHVEPDVDYEIDTKRPVQPFVNLAPLPDDLSEAFESYKLAILRHKLSGWQEISREDVLASLDALKQLALAPG